MVKHEEHMLLVRTLFFYVIACHLLIILNSFHATSFVFNCSQKALAYADELDNISRILTTAMVQDVSATSGKNLNVIEDKLFRT